jgi:site specific recombinase|nr:MAG TPA: site specific tyrosine recombinase [Caudoviricetes sp.]
MEEVSPIKDNDDIQAMKDYLREWNEMYYMLFITGLNTGLRVGDILTLKVKDVQGWHIKLRERKTGKLISRRMTKELKREMRKYVEGKPFHHFLFKSRQGGNKAITRERAYQIIHEAAEELGIDNVGTHTMRKTFGYKYYNKTKDVGTLQKMFNHSSPAITLRYIGIEQAELDDALRNFVI